MGPSWAILGPSWSHLGSIWRSSRGQDWNLTSQNARNGVRPVVPRRGLNPAALRRRASSVLDSTKELSKVLFRGVRPRRGRSSNLRPGFPTWCPDRLKTVKKPWFLRYFRFIGYFDIIYHIRDRILTILGLSWAILGRLGAILGRSWAILGPSWGDLGGILGHLGPQIGA